MIWLFFAATLLCAEEPANRWTGFRGTGDALSQAAPPVVWSATRNLAWAIDLPGHGQSSPVVWGGRIFLTSVEGSNKEKLLVHAWSLESGVMLWKREFASSRPHATGDRVSRAAPTAAVDGKLVYALFDSTDAIALTHDGEPVWQRNFNADYGAIQNGHDFGSSPRQSADSLFIHVNHLGPSYVVALDKATGKTRWKADLAPEGGWNTPVLVEDPKRPLVLVSHNGGAKAFHPDSGELLWKRDGEWSQASAIPSLAYAAGKVVVPSMNKGQSFALSLSAPGETAWKPQNAAAQYAAPLIHDGRVYLVNAVGALFCLDLETGAQIWVTRLPGPIWASPVAASGKLYFTTGEGVTVVMKPGPKPEVLATNELPVNGIVYATTPVENSILLRTLNQLWRTTDGFTGQPVLRTRIETKAAPPAALPEIPVETGRVIRADATPAAGAEAMHPKDGQPYRWIPPGKFRMGCSEDDQECAPDEKPVHEVTLTRGFWIGQTEVTVAAYQRFTRDTGRAMPKEPVFFDVPLNPGWANTKLPIMNVGWQEARGYCAWIGGRLPAEAEWEWAARTGQPAARYGALNEIAWYGDNSGNAPLDTTAILATDRSRFLTRQKENGNRPHPVGEKKPNAWGLYDMLGNLWEWTEDFYNPYSAAAQTDPLSKEESDRRAARGASWQYFPARVNASSRMRFRPEQVAEGTGFRCAQDFRK